MYKNVGFKVLLSIILGLGLVVSVVGGIATAQDGVAPVPAGESRVTSKVISQPVLSLTYARVVTDNAPVYADPSHASLYTSPIRSLGAGYVWISLADPQPFLRDGRLWYLINEDEYVRAGHLEIYAPATFQGRTLSRHPRRAFGWIIFDTWVSSAPGETPGDGSFLLPRYLLVTIHEARKVDEWTWYRIGDEHWVEQRSLGLVKSSPRPHRVKPADKWLEIDLYEQTLAAYEGNRMVYATLISSGLPWWQTEQGLFRVWAKIKMAKMSGRDDYPDYYFLEDVPWSLYFNKSFALHGAYWHDRFGFPHSHGCVNLAPKDAQWLFEWATPTTGPYNWTVATEENPGTWIWVHD